MSNYSKQKGKSFEREMAKYLSDIYGLNFERIPNSGAFVGGFNHFRSNKLTPEQLLLCEGDLICPKELGHIRFECKFHKDFEFSALFDHNGKLDEWITQAETGSRKWWYLFFKVNNKGSFVVFPYAYKSFLHLDQKNHLIYKQKYAILSLEGFFENNKDEIVRCGEPVPACNIAENSEIS